ncbi:hypothetical protein O9H85_28570 [Paenibacillus filicis]|uniref:DUF4203 domain-containing protein n=1 Tax=Paenibacillus gyeongsangnamensis TaxID=3388067 RepID=A0ABT4QHC2_9BACL|nr:hypothetical protein [Paenibacillus filicis]MCZ8516278.1 hypothetical protein [Paenibacillus filicis]
MKMWFLYTSMVVVIALTLYCMRLTYRNREKLTCMVGMMIAMTVGMMASITIGTFLGILQHDLVSSTIVSVLLGMLAGYWTGKPISLMASMDGMLAGIMGGMMGAMLGVMVLKTNTIIMFVDVIFLFIMIVLIQMVNEEVGIKKRSGKIGNGSFVIIVMGIGIVGAILYLEKDGLDVPHDSNLHGHMHSTSIVGEDQR